MRMHTKREFSDVSKGCSDVISNVSMSVDPWAPEQLPPLELAQVVEDCLFAYVNAQSQKSRDMMWPMLVESVEALISDTRREFSKITKEPRD